MSEATIPCALQVNGQTHELRVPAGTAVTVSARLGEAAPTELATLNYYSVKRGETMTTIARKLKVGRTDLADANYLKVTSRLAVGQQLLVPRETTTLMAARSDRGRYLQWRRRAGLRLVR